MQTATSLNTTLIDWLARMSAGRGAALVRGAQRFTALLSPLNPLETERPALHPDLALSLRIDSGLHQGASLELLQADYVIGSAEDCDIVLRDPSVAARHCRLTRGWAGFTVRDLRPAAPRTAAPANVSYHAGTIEVRYDLGTVQFTLQQAPAKRATAQQEQSHKRPVAMISLLALIVAVVAAVVAIAMTGRLSRSVPPPDAKQLATLNQALLGQGFASAHFGLTAAGGVELSGMVADPQQRRRLELWLAARHFVAARIHVSIATELLEQARRALSDGDARLEFRDGRLLVTGNSTHEELKSRIRALAADLQGTIPVEDRIAYGADAASAQAPGPLPVRVRSVMIGDPSYFLTDSGTRYFVGGVLPDGAEVLAIRSDEIEFSRGGHSVAYKLQ